MREVKPKVLLFLDVKRAHFYSKARRDICVELPPELRVEGEDNVAYLEKAMYGTRDAALCWQDEVTRVMKNLGFVQGLSNPCLFYHVRVQGCDMA